MSDPLNRRDKRQSEDGVLIRVEGVSKKFCRSLKRSLWYGFQDVVSELNPFSRSSAGGSSQELRQGEFWAVNDISFELRRGECLGLIGHNGAGKTTLLKMLNGLIKPDRGHIQMRGRVGALIALGAGFNPILSGRENVYVAAAVLGLSKREIEARIDEIIDFAEIEDFIDSPVQSYSSGMQVRLGFAVATTINPDVLLLDEVLAVGDARFRAKCYSRIDSIRRNCAMIFVSHDMPSIHRICTNAILMAGGRIDESSSVSAVVDKYLEQAAGSSELNPATCSQGLKSIQVSGMPELLTNADCINIQVEVVTEAEHSDISLLILVRDAYQQWVASASTHDENAVMQLRKGANRFDLTIESIPLKQGVYYLCVSVLDQTGGLLGFWNNGIRFRVRSDKRMGAGVCQLELSAARGGIAKVD
jgi:lipopolysaccharide transport system ATP-binding protein